MQEFLKIVIEGWSENSSRTVGIISGRFHDVRSLANGRSGEPLKYCVFCFCFYTCLLFVSTDFSAEVTIRAVPPLIFSFSLMVLYQSCAIMVTALLWGRRANFRFSTGISAISTGAGTLLSGLTVFGLWGVSLTNDLMHEIFYFECCIDPFWYRILVMTFKTAVYAVTFLSLLGMSISFYRATAFELEVGRRKFLFYATLFSISFVVLPVFLGLLYLALEAMGLEWGGFMSRLQYLAM